MVVFNTCAVRENADNKLYGNLGHLAPVKAQRPGMQIAVGGCLAQKDRATITEKAPWVDVVFGTHNIGVAAGAAGPGPGQRRGAGRDPRVARGLPAHAADPARVGVRRLGVGERRVQQHLHVLHRPGAARQGEGPPAGRDPRRGRGAGRRGRQRDHAARPERQRVRRGVRRPAGVQQAAARLRRHRRARAGPVHQPAPGGVHRRRHRGDGRDAQRDAEPAHAAAVRLRPRAQGDAAVLPLRRGTSASSTGSAPRSPTPRSRPTSSSASRARPRTTSRQTLDVVRAGAVQRAPSRSSTPSGPAPRPPTCPTRSARRSSRTATSGWSPSPTRSPGPRTRRQVGRRRRADGRRGRGPQGRRHRTGSPAAPATTGWSTSQAPDDRDPTGRRGHRRGHLRRAAPPRRRRPGRRTPHPLRRRVGGAHRSSHAPAGVGARHAERRRTRRRRLSTTGLRLTGC